MAKNLKTILLPLLAIVSFAALAADPERGDSAWDRLEQSGRWKVLRSQVGSRLKANPKDSDALIWQAKVLIAFGKGEESYKAAKDCVQSMPQSAEAWAQLAASAGLMAARASVLKKMSYAAECRDAGAKALELDPKNRMALEVMLNFYEQAPGIVGGDKKKASNVKATLESVDPEYRARNAVREAGRSRDNARIEAALKQAIQKHPKAAWPFETAARMALRGPSPKYQDVQSNAKKAIENNPSWARPYGHLVQAYAGEGRWGEVEAALLQSEKAVPENLHPHYLAATKLISASKEPKRAEALLRRYLSHEPEVGAPSRAQARYWLGLSLEQQGDNAGALKELKEASKALPKDKEIAAAIKRVGG
jgi:tetratricopeptide (TPR) repeat protein